MYVTKKYGSSLAKDGNWTQRPQMVLTDTLNSASQAESPCIVSALAMRWEGRAGGGDTAEVNDGVSKAEVRHKGSRASSCLTLREVGVVFVCLVWVFFGGGSSSFVFVCLLFFCVLA